MSNVFRQITSQTLRQCACAVTLVSILTACQNQPNGLGRGSFQDDIHDAYDAIENMSPGEFAELESRFALTQLHKANELIVKFREASTGDKEREVIATLDAEELQRFVPGAIHLRLEPELSTVDLAARMLALEDSHVAEYAELNLAMELHSATGPNDPKFSDLYALRNTGQRGGTPGADIDALVAWGITTGSPDVVVAVIDSGIDYNHSDLAANVWHNPGETGGGRETNNIDDDHNGCVDDSIGCDFSDDGHRTPMDTGGHGSHVAGTIGAVGNNGVGVTGVNWRVGLMALRVFDDAGYGWTDDIVRAIQFAVRNNVDVINASWGSRGTRTNSGSLYDAIAMARDGNVLFVASAGNDKINVDAETLTAIPSSYDLSNIVAVAATTQQDVLWAGSTRGSNYGAVSVDLAAPGYEIVSTYPTSISSSIGAAGYERMTGTSMAAPHVVGVAALIRAINPQATVAEMKNWLLAGVDSVPALAGKVVTGGRLNAAKTLALVTPPDDPIDEPDPALVAYQAQYSYMIYPASDYNDDGIVDSADLALWRNSDSRADGTGDCRVDGSDFLLWQREVGQRARMAGDLDRDGDIDEADLALHQSGTPVPPRPVASGSDYDDHILATTPVSYWRFEDPAGSTQASNTLSAPAAAVNSLAEFGLTGAIGNAVEFNGWNYLRADHSALYNFNTNDNFTISLWVRPTALQGDTTVNTNTILSKSGGGAFPYLLTYFNQSAGATLHGRIIFTRYDGIRRVDVSSHKSINDGAFHNVVMEKSGNMLRLYIDGALEDEEVDTSTGTTANSRWLLIGRSGEMYPEFFSGRVDELSIWNRALGASQVQALYTAGSSPTCH